MVYLFPARTDLEPRPVASESSAPNEDGGKDPKRTCQDFQISFPPKKKKPMLLACSKVFFSYFLTVLVLGLWKRRRGKRLDWKEA